MLYVIRGRPLLIGYTGKDQRVVKRRLVAVLAVLGSVALVLVGTGSPASANQFGTGGTTNSIWNFTTGSTQYVQQHNGDDFAFTNDTGISVDMQWQKCTDASVVGSIIYNIAPDHNYRNLGTDFLPTTCLRIKYRGFTQTGSFRGTTFWNYNWV